MAVRCGCMRAWVHLRAPSGQRYELGHGDIVGRLRTAALCIDDGRVSEAHAMVSLREQELRLISLRGAFAIDGRPLREVALRAGLRVQLARDLFVDVEEVCLPPEVLGIEGPELPRQALPPVCSFVGAPLRLARGWVEGAHAHAWSTGEDWRLRVGESEQLIGAGDVLGIAEERLQVVAIPLADAGRTATRHGEVNAPLHVVASFDTVHVQRDGVVVVTLSGVLARLVSELVAFGGPVAWETLSRELWPREEDSLVRRGRLDANLSRIRRSLRSASVRTDLVRTDGAGCVELLLHRDDTVEDRT